MTRDKITGPDLKRGAPGSPLLLGEGTRTLVALLVLFVTAVSPAATLPLQGWYRPGRFVPIRLAAGETSVTGDAVVPTDTAPVAHETVVPVLILGTPTDLTCGPATLPLRPVGPAEKLVASTGDATQAGQALFPGKLIDPIPLDLADPLPGPAAAWDGLDAIVLDATTMRRVGDETRATLLAAGVVLACPGPLPPDATWPWRREGARWILRHRTAGPANDTDEAAYAPTADWAPGPALLLRRRVILIAVLLMLASVALALMLPRQWALVGIALLVGGTVPGLLRWRASLGTLDQAGGDIIVAAGDGLAQRDIWLYQRARDDTSVTLPWSGDTRPVFASPTGQTALQLQLQLHIDAVGQLAYTYKVPAGHTLAWRRRLVQRSLPALPDPAARASPMRELARDGYLQKGQRIVGELPADTGRWNGVLIAP